MVAEHDDARIDTAIKRLQALEKEGLAVHRPATNTDRPLPVLTLQRAVSNLDEVIRQAKQ